MASTKLETKLEKPNFECPNFDPDGETSIFKTKNFTKHRYLDYIHLHNTQCGDMEMEFLQCAGRVGLINANSKCALLLEDLQECKFATKRIRRHHIMVEERLRQNRPEIPLIHPDAAKNASGMNTGQF